MTAVERRLLEARRDLIEVSNRTRLLNTRFERSGVHIVGERSDEVYRVLVDEGRSMTLAAGDGASPEDSDPPPQAADETAPAVADTAAEAGPLPHQLDGHLQSDLDVAALERRLLRMQYEARSQQEEQGVNILHLALGFLEWYESPSQTAPRFAPLILVPVALERSRAGAVFRIAATEDEPTINLSLREKLAGVFGVTLPDLPHGESEAALQPGAYAQAVATAIAGQPRWRVHANEIYLGFFSFARFLMFRDLDPVAWPEGRRLDAHPLIAGLLSGAAPVQPAPLAGDDDFLDELLPPERCLHVVDADSSQTLAIADVVHGRRSLVVQGPPGTGKSQTIANIIAGAVAAGSRVLFVAEKRAALDVVKRRLDAVGLGPACLELHSTKANRRAVLRELDSTLQLGRPRLRTGDTAAAQLARLGEVQKSLNLHAHRMHERDSVSGLSLYEVIVGLAALESRPRPWQKLPLEGCDRWSAADRSTHREAVAAAVDSIARGGRPDQHPWRGATVASMLPSDVERLMVRLDELAGRVVSLEATAEELRSALRTAGGQSDAGVGVAAAEAIANATQTAVPMAIERCVDIAQCIALCDHLRALPGRAASALTRPAGMVRDAASARQLEEESAAASEIVAALGEVERRGSALRARLAPGAETANAASLRRELAERRQSVLRHLSPAWYRLRRTVRALAASAADVTGGVDAESAFLEEIIALQSARRELELRGAVAARLFGEAWQGERSDGPLLESIVAWVRAGQAVGLPPGFSHLAARSVGWSTIDPAPVRAALADARISWEACASAIVLDSGEAFGTASWEEVPLSQLRERITAWRAEPQRLDEWIAMRRRLMALRESGLGAVAEGLTRGGLDHHEALEQFEHSYFEATLKRLDPAGFVLRFDAEEHEQLRARFIALDRERMAHARAEAALRHFEKLPRPEDQLGQMGLVRREIQKKSRHLPMRRLLGEAGEAIQRIKPLFMMSPLSVAQFLVPGGIEFDLVVFDEASQVRPVDALGAIARLAANGQLVVVGDDRQLPPTSFFRAEMDEEAELPDAQSGEDVMSGSVRDLESILGVCTAAGLPSRMLRWHYRSEHHSLIAVSNQLFYDARLHVVPSPQARSERAGLWMVHLPEATFDRGGGAVNQVEARAVAAAVMAHARETPGQSLGVGTFSVRQRDAILDELETLRRSSPETESFFAEGGPEPFFVKNLENIQGDERDVIFISVGYGRGPDGKLSMHFGPVSNSGGQRRLNVLMTRAKRRCVMFSSITDEEIDTARATGLGPAALKAFLRAARTGDLGGLGGLGGGAVQSLGADPLASLAAASLGASGYITALDVGVGGLRVELALKEAAHSPHFLLGVETDGPAYGEARTARDRERTRAAVLQARGWTLARLFASSWYRRRDESMAILVGAARAALTAESAAGESAKVAAPSEAKEPAPAPLAAEGSTMPPPKPTTAAVAAPALVRDPSRPVESAAPLVQSYELAQLRVPARTRPNEVPGERLRSIVEAIVEAEGPIHEEELERRMIALWGLRRTSAAMQEAVDTGVTLALLAKSIERDGPFLDRSGPARNAAPRLPRSRADVAAASLRRPELLPPAEIRALMLAIVTRHIGIDHETLVVETRKQFGLGTTTATIRELFDARLSELIAAGTILERGRGLSVGLGGDSSALRDGNATP